MFLLDSAGLVNWFLQMLLSSMGPEGCWLFDSPVTQHQAPSLVHNRYVRRCVLNGRETTWVSPWPGWEWFYDAAAAFLSSEASILNSHPLWEISTLQLEGWEDILTSSSESILETRPRLLSPRSFLWTPQASTPTSSKAAPQITG